MSQTHNKLMSQNKITNYTLNADLFKMTEEKPKKRSIVYTDSHSQALCISKILEITEENRDDIKSITRSLLALTNMVDSILRMATHTETLVDYTSRIVDELDDRLAEIKNEVDYISEKLNVTDTDANDDKDKVAAD
jgi:hypothetical protein